jgi:hypothetical protein
VGREDPAGACRETLQRVPGFVIEPRIMRHRQHADSWPAVAERSEWQVTSQGRTAGCGRLDVEYRGRVRERSGDRMLGIADGVAESVERYAIDPGSSDELEVR